MGYVSVADADGFKVTADKALWFYAILAMPLVALTIVTYFLCERLSRRKVRGPLQQTVSPV